MFDVEVVTKEAGQLAVAQKPKVLVAPAELLELSPPRDIPRAEVSVELAVSTIGPLPASMLVLFIEMSLCVVLLVLPFIRIPPVPVF